MPTIVYDKKYIGPFGKRYQCTFCSKTMNSQEIEILDFLVGKMFFCKGHLIKWIKQQQKEWMLKKL